jgi:hypothetical protein
MQLTGCDQTDEVLSDLAEHICRHVGCGSAAVAEVIEELKAILSREPELEGALDVQFRCRPESLDVSVSARGRELWFTSRRLGS